eukprot:TRINITY_DN3052_c0_g3_i2.p1 TRINITY_DN3052_c0_g3~~TRINITY_DN3052_c0_g3_i2.p1  ORF type:complete len:387 (-),score=38.48 TRINITY_DN3052_c0_g3_i2:117-1277(-)
MLTPPDLGTILQYGIAGIIFLLLFIINLALLVSVKLFHLRIQQYVLQLICINIFDTFCFLFAYVFRCLHVSFASYCVFYFFSGLGSLGTITIASVVVFDTTKVAFLAMYFFEGGSQLPMWPLIAPVALSFVCFLAASIARFLTNNNVYYSIFLLGTAAHWLCVLWFGWYYLHKLWIHKRTQFVVSAGPSLVSPTERLPLQHLVCFFLITTPLMLFVVAVEVFLTYGLILRPEPFFDAQREAWFRYDMLATAVVLAHVCTTYFNLEKVALEREERRRQLQIRHRARSSRLSVTTNKARPAPARPAPRFSVMMYELPWNPYVPPSLLPTTLAQPPIDLETGWEEWSNTTQTQASEQTSEQTSEQEQGKVALITPVVETDANDELLHSK